MALEWTCSLRLRVSVFPPPFAAWFQRVRDDPMPIACSVRTDHRNEASAVCARASATG
jgi:hypothetical protein